MNLVIDLPYDVVVGSVAGITLLGVVYLITRTIVKINENKARGCSCKKDAW